MESKSIHQSSAVCFSRVSSRCDRSWKVAKFLGASSDFEDEIGYSAKLSYTQLGLGSAGWKELCAEEFLC